MDVNNGDYPSPVQSPPYEEDIPTDTILDSSGIVVTFKLLNKEVYDYSYYESDGTFHVITYEAKLKQQDIMILLDDGLGILMHIYYAAVAAVSLFSYRKREKQLKKLF